MSLSYQRRLIAKDILWTLLFFIIGLNLYMISRYWRVDYTLSEFMADTFVATIGGIFGGGLLALFHNSGFYSRFVRKSLGFLLLIETFFDLVVTIFVFVPIATLSRQIFYGDSFAVALEYNIEYMQTLAFIGLLIYIMMLVVLLNFIRIISKKFGSGVMLGLLMGRYNHPREEERIFMFLDLKASTTLAEHLGHLTYSRLLQDCFFDLNRTLLPFEAHIYKYVGDEAILTWTLPSGLKAANCLHLFFAFHKRLKERTPHYMSKYGVVPEFKAGINSGLVTVAEVGEYRREIEYHGDVLNTAARIQGQCNVFGKQILVAKNLVDQLLKTNFEFEEIGLVELKGKQDRVRVFSVATQ